MSGLMPAKQTPVPKKPDPNNNTGLAINLGDKIYEADLAQYNALRSKISEDITAPTREEISNREIPQGFKSMGEAFGYVNSEVGYRQAMQEYNAKVKEQEELRKQYPNWKEWAIDSDTVESTKPAIPTSTPRNNSILTGVTGDTQANIKRYQLEDATRKKRKSLLGE